ncbi:MAG: hypothetical protein A2168_06785 [Planctomycetes bacterium RBG_13_50_24]|nr:MAG: hypothetical protein A2168_06785 [Planctomycetes bacterium RBG_13_50_24]
MSENQEVMSFIICDFRFFLFTALICVNLRFMKLKKQSQLAGLWPEILNEFEKTNPICERTK